MKEGTGVLEEDIDRCGMGKFGTLDGSKKTIDIILGDRWWPQTAKQEGDKLRKTKNMPYIWKKRNERPSVGGVYTSSRNGAPSRKGCVVNGQMPKAST